MNAFEKYNLDDVEKIKTMIAKASKVKAWVVTNDSGDGVYLQVTKSSLLSRIKDNPMAFESNQFDLNLVQYILYIN